MRKLIARANHEAVKRQLGIELAGGRGNDALRRDRLGRAKGPSRQLKAHLAKRQTERERLNRGADQLRILAFQPLFRSHIRCGNEKRLAIHPVENRPSNPILIAQANLPVCARLFPEIHGAHFHQHSQTFHDFTCGNPGQLLGGPAIRRARKTPHSA
jgi:hypothetical protein